MNEEQEKIIIGGEVVLPGERKTIKLHMPTLYDCSPMFMPVHVIRGKEKGPILLVTAAIHGDEINGVDIVRRILQRKMFSRLKGSIIAVPTVNVYGFLYQSRYLMDRRDLNRSFPGSETGSIAARLAHMVLTELACHATHIIDLHTGSLHRSNLPQIRVNLDNPKNKALANAFNAPVILDLLEPPGSFRYAVKESGKPFLLYEAGEALRFNEFSIKMGVKGIFRVMRHLGMLPPLKNPVKDHSTLAYSSYWIRAESSGTILFTKKLGDTVKRGEIIAKAANPLTGEEVLVKAKKTGVVIGKSNLPLAHEGEAIFHIACLDKPKEVSDRVSQLQEMLDVQ